LWWQGVETNSAKNDDGQIGSDHCFGAGKHFYRSAQAVPCRHSAQPVQRIFIPTSSMESGIGDFYVGNGGFSQ
jgi:hypothetical protein